MKKQKVNRPKSRHSAQAPLAYKGYSGSVSFSQEDEVFYGKILGVNDTVTYEAETAKNLTKAFREAVDDYLKTCEKMGKPPSREFKGSFNVRIQPELHRKAHLKSQALNVSMNKYIEEIIKREVGREAR